MRPFFHNEITTTVSSLLVAHFGLQPDRPQLAGILESFPASGADREKVRIPPQIRLSLAISAEATHL